MSHHTADRFKAAWVCFNGITGERICARKQVTTNIAASTFFHISRVVGSIFPELATDSPPRYLGGAHKRACAQSDTHSAHAAPTWQDIKTCSRSITLTKTPDTLEISRPSPRSSLQPAMRELPASLPVPAENEGGIGERVTCPDPSLVFSGNWQ